MIYGIGDIVFEYTYNAYNKAILTIEKAVGKFEWNIPDIIIQKSLNGHVWKEHKGFYHKFFITVYNPSARVTEFINMICKCDGSSTITPHATNALNKYEINSISNPFYVSDINGNLGITIEVTTKNYSDLAVEV